MARRPSAAALAILELSMNGPSFRIIGAFCVGIALIGVAFYADRYRPAPGPEEQALTGGLQPQETGALAPREFIPVSDSDGDNVPDWQDQFDTPTVILDGKPDAERANTLTNQAAVRLAETYFSDSTDETLPPNLRIEELAAELAAGLASTTYTAADMQAAGDSTAAWRAYGNQVAAITFEHQVAGEVEYELVLLDRALAFRNERALQDLARISDSYDAMAAAMLATPAPTGLMEAHVSLTNAYAALAADIGAFAKVLEDPMLATIHFGRYPESVDRLYTTIITLYTTLDAEGITWRPGDPAYELIEVQE